MFNKNRKIHFTNQMYKVLCPLVDIPTYSEKEIAAEYDELSSIYKAYKKKMTLKRLFYVSTVLIIQFLLNIVIVENYESLVFNVEFLQRLERLEIDFLFYFNIWIIFQFIVALELYFYSTGLKPSKPALDKAEFSLRMKLTQPQLKNASNEKIQQIWAYCNSALIKPIKI